MEKMQSNEKSLRIIFLFKMKCIYSKWMNPVINLRPHQVKVPVDQHFTSKRVANAASDEKQRN